MFFSKNNSTRTPFGKNAYLRSVRDIKTDSYTFAKSAMPEVLFDGAPATVNNKVLASNVVTLTTTAAHNFQVGDTVVVAISDAAYDGRYVIRSVPSATTFTYDKVAVNSGPTAATGTAKVGGDFTKVLQPGTLIAKITSGTDSGKVGVFMAGVSDGRQTVANVIGVADTFLPWELTERDANIAVTYEATVVQAWCFEYNAAGAPIALTNTTRDAIIAANIVGLKLNYR